MSRMSRSEKPADLRASTSASFIAPGVVVSLVANPSIATRFGDSAENVVVVGSDSENVADGGSDSGLSPAVGVAHCDDVPKLQSRFEGTLSGRQNPDLAVKRALSAYGREHPGTYAGQWIDRDNGGVLMMGFTDDPEPHRAAILARRPWVYDGLHFPPKPLIAVADPLTSAEYRDSFPCQAGLTFAARNRPRCVAPSQLAADLLTGPGPEPSQGEEMLRWMQDNEDAWRS